MYPAENVIGLLYAIVVFHVIQFFTWGVLLMTMYGNIKWPVLQLVIMVLMPFTTFYMLIWSLYILEEEEKRKVAWNSIPLIRMTPN